jgi:hypothetical protein
MKKILNYIGAFFTLFMISSCDELDQVPYSFTSPENVYHSESDFNLALVGCYEAINTSSIVGKWVPDGNYARGLFYMLDGCSDVAMANNVASTLDYTRATYLPTHTEINLFWIAFYGGISRCNYLLDYVDNGDLTDAQKIQFKAESRFLRAFYYYHLAFLFGGVPKNTTSTPDPYAERASLEEIYELIISDFRYAYENIGSTGLYGCSANKWTAGAYLGMIWNYLASCKRYKAGASLISECPLNSFDWVDADQMSQNALAVLADVYNNSPYVLLPQEQYSYLFRESTKSYQKKECLFMSEWSETTSDTWMAVAYAMTPNGTNTYGGSYGRLVPSVDLYKSYSNGDIRRDWNIRGRFTITSSSKEEYIDGVGYWIPNNPVIGSNLEWHIGKYRIADANYNTLHTNVYCSLNHPLMRLTDVILQYAEALYFTGDESKARFLFNDIRGRVADGTSATLADLNTKYYKADFVEELLDERKRELCFESKRRVDLIRFDKTTEVIANLPVEGGSVLKGHIQTLKDNWEYYKIWMPIPQSQIDLNVNLVQNAGW